MWYGNIGYGNEFQRVYGYFDKMFVVMQLSAVEQRCRTTVAEKEQVEEKLKELEREKKASEKKIAQLQTKMTKANAELKEEKEVRPNCTCTRLLIEIVRYALSLSLSLSR